MMFRTLAIGYSVALSLALAGMAAVGGSLLLWGLFIWLAGAPLTLGTAALRTLIAAHGLPLPALAARRRLPVSVIR